MQRAEQVAIEPDQVVGRHGKIRKRQSLGGLEARLRRGRGAILVQARDQPVGAVADLADVDVVELRIHFRRAGDGRAAERDDLAGRFGAAGDVADLRRLNVHAADKHGIGPGEIGGARRRDIFIDEADRPLFGHISRDQQKPLRRHESAHPPEQMIGMRERAEGRRIGRKHAEDAARIAGG